MRKNSLLFLALMLTCNSAWADADKEDVDNFSLANAIPTRKKEGSVFYVSPYLPTRYHSDILQAAAAWNQYLPQDVQIQIAFTKEEWNRKVKNSHLRRYPNSTGTDNSMLGFLRKFGTYGRHAAIANAMERVPIPIPIREPNNTIGSIKRSPRHLAEQAEKLRKTGSSSMLGVTSPVPNHSDGYKTIAKTAIVLNDVFHKFCTSAEMQEPSCKHEADVYTTMLHEFGHALGIRGHSDNPHSTMYYSDVDTAHNITQEEIDFIRTHYGDNTEESSKGAH